MLGFRKTLKITVQILQNLLQITSEICMSADTHTQTEIV